MHVYEGYTQRWDENYWDFNDNLFIKDIFKAISAKPKNAFYSIIMFAGITAMRGMFNIKCTHQLKQSKKSLGTSRSAYKESSMGQINASL